MQTIKQIIESPIKLINLEEECRWQRKHCSNMVCIKMSTSFIRFSEAVDVRNQIRETLKE